MHYRDDVNILSEDDKDITVVNKICRDFEEASSDIFNRNCKTALVDLGSWEGPQGCRSRGCSKTSRSK